MRIASICINICIICAAGVLAHGAGSDDLTNGAGNSLRIHYDHDLVSWIKDASHDAYDSLVAKDRYDSTRLLLLCFGFIGVIGIRRRVKKQLSGGDISQSKSGVTGFKSTA